MPDEVRPSNVALGCGQYDGDMSCLLGTRTDPWPQLSYPRLLQLFAAWGELTQHSFQILPWVNVSEWHLLCSFSSRYITLVWIVAGLLNVARLYQRSLM